MPSSIAHVPTTRAARYVKQLGDHFGRKVTVTDGPQGRLAELAGGTCLLHASDEAITLTATGGDSATLEQVQDVVGRHLERFGARDELSVQWGSPTS